MGSSKQSFSKREKQKKRRKEKLEKQEKMVLRRANKTKGKPLEEMLAFVDENGQIVSTPPAPPTQAEGTERPAGEEKPQ
ncbi:MAG TPA: hypothetical protein VN616_12130 [Puia sp.]|nr:hypothetical protein [Puia sp.]